MLHLIIPASLIVFVCLSSNATRKKIASFMLFLFFMFPSIMSAFGVMPPVHAQLNPPSNFIRLDFEKFLTTLTVYIDIVLLSLATFSIAALIACIPLVTLFKLLVLISNKSKQKSIQNPVLFLEKKLIENEILFKKPNEKITA